MHRSPTTQFSPRVTRDFSTVNANRESLNALADETGGRFFKDANNLSAPLSEINDMTSRYYILGYQPTDLAGPGHYHKLKVRVQRKGGRTSHRAGYFEHVARAQQSVLQRKFESAQLVMTGCISPRWPCPFRRRVSARPWAS